MELKLVELQLELSYGCWEALYPGCHLMAGVVFVECCWHLRKALHTFRRALLFCHKAPALAVKEAACIEENTQHSTSELQASFAFELIIKMNKSSRKCCHSLSHSVIHSLTRLLPRCVAYFLCLSQFFIYFVPDHGKSIKLPECNGNRFAEVPPMQALYFFFIVISLFFPVLSFLSFVYISLNAHSCWGH